MRVKRRGFVLGKLLFGMALPMAGLSLAVGVVPGGGLRLGPATVRPTNSSPLALTHDDAFVWVANPDSNSVSLLHVGGDVNVKVRELKVGAEPQCVAITPNDAKVYVTNMVSGTVSVIDAVQQRVVRTILVGTEPYGCALTPDGSKLYVANFSSDDVSVINTATDQVIKTIAVGPKPRGIAINTDGKVYVTQFLAQLRPGGVEGRDDGKQGRVTVINSATNTILTAAILNPIANTGFNSNGSSLDRIPPTDPATFTFVTGAYPNLLQGIVIKGGKVYLPCTGTSPNGPFRFNVNVQSLLAGIDTATNLDANITLNMNKGIQFEAVGKKLFPTNPIAIAFKNGANEGYVCSAATNRILKVVLDGSGVPTVNAPMAANDPGNVIRTEVGAFPQGIVINSTDTRAYVMNYLSRDVSAVNIAASVPVEIARIASAGLPAAGTLDAVIHRGHELFNTSVGPAGTLDDALPPAGRMSDFGWGSCYSCHPSGLHDGATWLFPDGPRQTISMESTGERPQPLGPLHLNANGAPLLPDFRQRVLNWSAVRDEVQDFELNIRAVSGGQGLIKDGLGVFNLVPTANTGRDADLDALAAYVALGIRAPISPLRPKNVGGGQADPEIAQGRALFASANCQSCHGGPNWTRSRVDFVPPPLGETITVGQLVRFLTPVGTFDPAAFNEVRTVGTTIVTANGALGFNIPSLLSVFAGAPYLHNGAAPTLDDEMNGVLHRAAGTGGVDILSSAADRAKLVKFLKSIDARTPIFP